MKQREETHTLHTCLTMKAKWAEGLKDWADEQHSSFSKGAFTFHGGRQRYLPGQFRPGQRVYLRKRYNKSCLLHEAARQQPEKHPPKILSDTYNVLSVLCSLWDFCSLAYIPPFIKPIFPDWTVNRDVCYCRIPASKLYLLNIWYCVTCSEDYWWVW